MYAIQRTIKDNNIAMTITEENLLMPCVNRSEKSSIVLMRLVNTAYKIDRNITHQIKTVGSP